mgnify:FL=1
MRDREALHQLATRLVPHLGGGWTYPTDRNADKCGLHNYALLVREDGLEIHLSEHRDRGKVSIGQAYTADAWVSKRGTHAETKHEPHYRWVRPEIGVSATKSDKRIAGDILRRLLPDAEANHAEALEVKARWDAATDAQAARAAQLGMECTDIKRDYYAREWGGRATGGELHVKATLATDGGFDLKCRNLTEAQARAVLELLGQEV